MKTTTLFMLCLTVTACMWQDCSAWRLHLGNSRLGSDLLHWNPLGHDLSWNNGFWANQKDPFISDFFADVFGQTPRLYHSLLPYQQRCNTKSLSDDTYGHGSEHEGSECGYHGNYCHANKCIQGKDGEIEVSKERKFQNEQERQAKVSRHQQLERLKQKNEKQLKQLENEREQILRQQQEIVNDMKKEEDVKCQQKQQLERQREHEMKRQKEAQRLYQQEKEKERQRDLEFQRLHQEELERQREADRLMREERQRQIKVERQRQHQEELNKQREMERLYQEQQRQSREQQRQKEAEIQWHREQQEKLKRQQRMEEQWQGQPNHHGNKQGEPNHHGNRQGQPNHHGNRQGQPSHHGNRQGQSSHHGNRQGQPSHHGNRQGHPNHHGNIQGQPSHHGNIHQPTGNKVEIFSHVAKDYDLEDFTISTHGNSLHVTGRHVCKCNENCFEREFERRVAIPRGVDTQSLSATYNSDGVLKIEGLQSRNNVQNVDTNIQVQGLGLQRNTAPICNQLKSGIKLKKLNKNTGEIFDDPQMVISTTPMYENEIDDDGVTIETEEW